MSESYKNSIARIVRYKDNTPIGGGILVGARQVLTCAHVVNEALGLKTLSKDSPPPESRITLDFPLPAPGVFLTAKVVKWEGPREDGGGDMALLELETDVPNSTTPAPFTVPGDVWGNTFRAFGFPNHHPQGRDASGRLLGRNAIQRLMMEQTESGRNFALPGFSGTGVWDERLGALIGMTVLGEFGPQMSAFLIPTDELQKFWPELPVGETQTYGATKPASFEYHVYISCAESDETWVTNEVLSQLKNAGLKVYLDYLDRPVGMPKPKAQEWAVQNSQKTLLILSPAYVKDQWREFEAVMLQSVDPLNIQLRLIPLLKEPCDLPMRLSMLTSVDFTNPERRSIAWNQLFRALG